MRDSLAAITRVQELALSSRLRSSCPSSAGSCVSLVSAAGTWYVNKLVAVVPGQLPYATTLSLNVPAGSYRAAVYWRPPGSTAWVLANKSGLFGVTL